MSFGMTSNLSSGPKLHRCLLVTKPLNETWTTNQIGRAKLQMNWLSLRNNWVKFKTSGKLRIILEEFGYYQYPGKTGI
jgi:hypothetical protein